MFFADGAVQHGDVQLEKVVEVPVVVRQVSGPGAQKTVEVPAVAVFGQGEHARRCATTGAGLWTSL